ncbi:unnamed protein product [Candidula unifasciata]|uniref:Polypeptide N-acetylgalactosaminyltransferase n=1 Tax=Candidula unifasciata TaxID=100452 RepID=A0A8S3ZY18_9EUPU|nr:unnamed protein product [Candidula unifasciata]
MIRLKKSRILLFLLAVCIAFWFLLYWIFSDIYSRQRHFRFRSKPAVEDILPAFTLILEKLAKIQTADDQRNYNAGYQNHAFNQMLSDKLSFTRPLPDARFERCREKTYPTDLPSTSLIICFYNEALSALLRTVHTVLARSPAHLIHEIILVDDFSDFDYLKTDLEGYIERNLPKVRLFHTTERLGLIRARMFGAEQASSQTLLFLDSHCEVNTGWLEPLLHAIQVDQHTVAVPLIDIVDADTFFYEQSSLVKGGFNWGMHYQWEPLSSDVANVVYEKAEPYESPTMAGGLFAINREYFHQLGEYDGGMDVWGGENLELSFRIWLCGGRLVIVPCSRVGHIFRKRRPYGAGVTDSFTKNTLRMVHVWLDEYKKYYFHINPRAEDMEFGNITGRIKLRKDLNCKSFQWYLENVYPEQLKKLPDLNRTLYPNQENKQMANELNVPVVARGLLKHMGSGLCVQSEKSVVDKRALLKLAVCKEGNKDQLWYETEQKDLRLANLLCLDVNKDEGPYARLMKCKGLKVQTWIWSKQGVNTQLINHGSSKCLVATGVDPGSILKTTKCSQSPLMYFSLV